MLGRRRCRDDAGTDLVRRSSGPWRVEQLQRGRERLGAGERRGSTGRRGAALFLVDERGGRGFGRARRISSPWIEQVESCRREVVGGYRVEAERNFWIGGSGIWNEEEGERWLGESGRGDPEGDSVEWRRRGDGWDIAPKI